MLQIPDACKTRHTVSKTAKAIELLYAARSSCLLTIVYASHVASTIVYDYEHDDGMDECMTQIDSLHATNVCLADMP